MPHRAALRRGLAVRAHGREATEAVEERATTMERVTLEIEARTPGKSSAAQAVRRSGRIPGVFYGNGRDPQAIAVDAKALRTAIHDAGGRHAIFDVVAPGGTGRTPAILKDF